MMSAWLNATVTVQRRIELSRNTLNEPVYGNESDYPVIYPDEYVRIEYESQSMQFTTAGERVDPTKVLMYIENLVYEEDRVTVLTSDDPSQVGMLFLIKTVQPEWNAVGNVHHYLCELMVH